jgi:hypothetical protein
VAAALEDQAQATKTEPMALQQPLVMVFFILLAAAVAFITGKPPERAVLTVVVQAAREAQVQMEAPIWAVAAVAAAPKKSEPTSNMLAAKAVAAESSFVILTVSPPRQLQGIRQFQLLAAFGITSSMALARSSGKSWHTLLN